MNQHDHITAALEAVSAWNIPDERLIQIVNDWANLMAKVSPDELWEDPPENH